MVAKLLNLKLWELIVQVNIIMDFCVIFDAVCDAFFNLKTSMRL
jgi:hypothetical protein